MAIKGHQISISLATVQTWVLKDTKAVLVSFNTHVCTVASDILLWCPLIPISVP
jgi:hypothetical protein